MISISIFNSGQRLEKDQKAKVMDFLEKLQADDTTLGLHIEPIKNSADRRVRTGRVDRKLRAVLFKITGSNNEPHYIYIGTYNHDDAIAKAMKTVLRVNPYNGIPELIEATTPKPRDHYEVEPETPPAKTSDVLSLAGLDVSPLQEELGISPATLKLLSELESDEELEKAFDEDERWKNRPAWEKDAIIGLLAGMTIAEVKKSLDLEPLVAHTDDDAALLAGLKHPAARMDFVYIDADQANSDDLRKAIEAPDFDQWLLYLHPEQRRIIDRNFTGSARVFGGAGTGKTVVALHRAHRLATTNENPLRILLTTFTKNLAASLKSQMSLLAPDYLEAEAPGDQGTYISGIDALATRILRDASNDELAAAMQSVFNTSLKIRPRALSDREEKQFWHEALEITTNRPTGPAANSTFLSQEYETVVLANQISKQSAYLRVPRIGRGHSLNRTERKKVWEVIEIFQQKCVSAEKATFAAIALLAATILDNRAETTGKRLFDHVVIDEAQDFHAGHWKLLRASVDLGPNDIFLAEDSHQRIYGQRLVLSRFNIKTLGGASQRLTLNYRTTKEVLDYAVQMLTGEEWIDSEGQADSTTHYRSARRGPKPQVIVTETEAEEVATVAEAIKVWKQEKEKNARIGILVRTNGHISRVVDALAEHGITATAANNVSVMTMHNAKGLEFSHVVLMGVNNSSLPLDYLLDELNEPEQQDFLQRERALLYVAASRARDQLLITLSGKASDLLPKGQK